MGGGRMVTMTLYHRPMFRIGWSTGSGLGAVPGLGERGPVRAIQLCEVKFRFTSCLGFQFLHVAHKHNARRIHDMAGH